MPENCPIPKGKYEMDWCPDLSNLPPNFIGTYKTETFGYYNGKPNTKITFIAQLQRYLYVG